MSALQTRTKRPTLTPTPHSRPARPWPQNWLLQGVLGVETQTLKPPLVSPTVRVRPTVGHALLPTRGWRSVSWSSPGSSPAYLQRIPLPPSEKLRQRPGTATACPLGPPRPSPSAPVSPRLQDPRSWTPVLAARDHQARSCGSHSARGQVRAGPEDTRPAPPPKAPRRGLPPPLRPSRGAPPSGRQAGTRSALSRPAAPAPASFPLRPLPPPSFSAAEAAGVEPGRTEPRPQPAAGAEEAAAGRAAGGQAGGGGGRGDAAALLSPPAPGAWGRPREAARAGRQHAERRGAGRLRGRGLEHLHDLGRQQPVPAHHRAGEPAPRAGRPALRPRLPARCARLPQGRPSGRCRAGPQVPAGGLAARLSSPRLSGGAGPAEHRRAPASRGQIPSPRSPSPSRGPGPLSPLPLGTLPSPALLPQVCASYLNTCPWAYLSTPAFAVACPLHLWVWWSAEPACGVTMCPGYYGS